MALGVYGWVHQGAIHDAVIGWGDQMLASCQSAGRHLGFVLRQSTRHPAEYFGSCPNQYPKALGVQRTLYNGSASFNLGDSWTEPDVVAAVRKRSLCTFVSVGLHLHSTSQHVEVDKVAELALAARRTW